MLLLLMLLPLLLLAPAAGALALEPQSRKPPAREGSRWTAAGGTPDGWRLALDVGREAGTAMPAGWARSGCRLPLVVRCDFEGGDGGGGGGGWGWGRTAKAGEATATAGRVVPKVDEVRFTGPGGEVRGRIEGGEWKASPSSGEGGGGIGLSFGLSFPDELSRRDVTLRGTVRCEGTLYSTEGLRELDAEYYAARDAKWEAGKAAGEALERAEAPRRWNPESERWERRYEEEGAASKLWKRARYLLAERRERSVTDRRPMPKELSMDCGPFPGIEGEAYARRGGRIVLEGGGWGGERVVGTWSMEPISDRPVSYRGT